MTTTKEYLKEKGKEAYQLAADPTIPVKEVFRQYSDLVRKDWSNAEDYVERRKIRKKAVAERLQQLRKSRGLKQQEVADLTGLNVVTLSGYEIAKNEPNLEALVRLADVYEVSLDYLMCRTDE